VTELQDEVSFFQLGQAKTYHYLELQQGHMQISSWLDFPSRYKFTGIEVLLNKNKIEVNRQTYDVLQYIGDLGGLFEALYILGCWFMYTYKDFAY